MKTFILILCLCLAATCADKPATIDFTQPILDLDRNPIPGGDAKTPVLTLGIVAVNALESTLEEDRGQTGSDKFKADELARKVYKAKAAVLTVEEISLIKTRIGKAYGPLIVGYAWRLLDPATK